LKHLCQSRRDIAGLTKWVLVLNKGGVLNCQILFVLTRPKWTWIWLYSWPLVLGSKLYERTPIRTYDRIWQGPRNRENMSDSSGPTKHIWIGSLLDPHAQHVYPWCIINIEFYKYRMRNSPDWHTRVTIGCLWPTKCAKNVMSKFCLI